MEKQSNILKEKVKEVEYVNYQTSFSSTEPQSRTMNYEIWWDRDNNYGGFELYDEESGGEDYYAEGGLWFDEDTLTDYDGMFEIPATVVDTLKKMGANVKDFEV